ncbi:MAG: HPr(Ser) kinase/phosphatase [Burkholderiales bacterium]|jgi:HPr kinase/phosphorylase|nr:HPr(Ser) kinase/phosphatase [Burkholderiales bacterium]
MRTITIEKLFDDNKERLQLDWVAGQTGIHRLLEGGDEITHPTTSLIGHLNLIHTFHVQVLGTAEISYLEGLSEERREQAMARLFATKELSTLIVIGGEALLPLLSRHCNEHHVPLLVSKRHSPHVVDTLRLYLLRELAEYITAHGVFLDVLEMGVLITGASAIGKSELALELITRGNGLVADDIVELHRISPDTIEGRCPPLLRDFLEVRGIGVLNIRQMFGETAVRPHKLLRLIVHLEDHNHEAFANLDRLGVEASYQDILGVPIRKVIIPVAAGRNLAVLVEAAVRNFVLNRRGIDSALEFIERHSQALESEL